MKRNRGFISNRVLAGLTILSACLLFPAGGLQTTVSAQEWGTTTITQNIALGGATNIDGDLIVQANLNLNGQVMTVTGDVLLESDVDLAGGTLKIEGSLHQVDSSLVVNNGTLQVRGNYSIEGKEPDENGEMPVSYGWIKMENEADTIIVAGDFSARSYNSSVMSAGTMEFQGNVTDHYGNTIRGSGEHLAVFSGTGNQVVDLQSSSACFQSIRTINTDVTFRQMGFCMLTEDIELTGDVEDIWNKMDLNGHTLTINGNVNRLSADLNLNGGHLAVSGNFHHFDPSIVFNQGTLEVGGNYILEAEDTDEDGTPEPSYGWLKMENEADRFIVRGDFSARSYNSSVMTAGTIEFQGNVTDHYGNTIRGSGEHLAVFSGKDPQVVEFEHESSSFQSIRTVNEAVHFKTLGVNQLTEDVRISGPIEKIWNKLDLNGFTLQIDGSVDAVMSDINLNRGLLYVSGNFRQLDPNITFNGGTLRIDGTYYLAGVEEDENGEPGRVYGWLKMEAPEDHMIVFGDFVANSYNSSVMSGGIVEIGGKIYDYAGNTLRLMGNGSNDTTVVSGIELDTENTAQG